MMYIGICWANTFLARADIPCVCARRRGEDSNCSFSFFVVRWFVYDGGWFGDTEVMAIQEVGRVNEKGQTSFLSIWPHSWTPCKLPFGLPIKTLAWCRTCRWRTLLADAEEQLHNWKCLIFLSTPPLRRPLILHDWQQSRVQWKIERRSVVCR